MQKLKIFSVDLNMKNSVRALAFIMVFLYPYCIDALVIDFTPVNFLGYARRLIFGIVSNFGLYFITTKQAKKMKIIALILYLPTLTFSPIFTFGLHVYLPILFIFVAIGILIKFFPWRSDASLAK